MQEKIKHVNPARAHEIKMSFAFIVKSFDELNSSPVFRENPLLQNYVCHTAKS
jgi:hypothetical protein